MALIAAASLLGYAALLQRMTGRNASLCIVTAVAGATAVLYAAALVGVLRVAAIATYVLGLVAGATAGAHIVSASDRRTAALGFLRPGVVIFLLSIVAYSFAYSGLTCRQWDEFTRWAVAARQMCETHAVPGSDSWSQFADYPPATALLDYFFLQGVGFREDILYVANFTLLAAPLQVLLAYARWTQVHRIVVTTVLAALLVCGIGCGVQTLYVDTILGAWFGAVLTGYFLFRDDAPSLALLAPCAFLLPIIKLSGAFLAIASATIVATDTALRVLRSREGHMKRYATAASAAVPITAGYLVLLYYGQREVANRLVVAGVLLGVFVFRRHVLAAMRWCDTRRAASAAAVAVLLSAPIISAASWRLWTDMHSVRRSFSRGSVTSAVLSTIGPSARPLATRVAGDVARRWLAEPLAKNADTVGRRLQKVVPGFPGVPRLSAAIWLLIALAGLAAIGMSRAVCARGLWVAAGLLLLLCAAYTAGLLNVYLYLFSPGEQKALAEFERYVWSFLLGLQILTWGLMLNAPTGGRTRIAGAALGIAVAWLYVFENGNLLVVPDMSQAPPLAGRAATAEEISFIRQVTPQGAAVLVVDSEPTWLASVVVRYELAPRRCEAAACRGGLLYPEAAHYFDTARPGELLRVLQQGKYDYIFAAGAPGSEFWKYFAGDFPSERRVGECLWAVRHTRGKAYLQVLHPSTRSDMARELRR